MSGQRNSESDGRTAVARTASGLPSRQVVPRSNSHRLFIVVRTAALLAFAAFAWADSPDGRSIVPVLLAAAVAQPLIGALLRQPDVRRTAFVLGDLVATALVTLIVPEYYWLGVMVLISLMAGQAAAVRLRRYVWIGCVIPLLVLVTGRAADVEHLERAVVMAAILAAINGLLGQQIRGSLDAARHDLEFAVEASGGFIHVTDLDSGLTKLHGDVEGVVGWPLHEWMTMDQFRVVHPDDHGEFRVDAADLVPGEVIERTGRIRTRDGRWVWVHDTSRVVDAGDHIELHGFTVDVTAQKAGLERVTAEATTDALTGLPNRRALTAELDRLERVGGYHLVLIDLNRFKDVNDTLGHEAGDVMLRVVADRIVESMRGVGLVARLGGDEFAIVDRNDIDTAVVRDRLDTLAAELAAPMHISGVNVTTSVSAGIVRAEPGTGDRSTMLRHADTAMYVAKERGVTAVVFDRRMGDELEQRSALSNQVGDALANEEIVLYFQPVVDAADGGVVAAEGLVRWEHPELGLLTPDAFLDLVLLSERAGEFNRAMVAQAIRAVRWFEEAGRPIAVAVNVPVRTLEDAGFESWFVEECRRLRVDPAQLLFEIAEQDLHHEEITGLAIDRFTAIGVGIAIDDFGTGHATFDRLRWRNVRQLKLDPGIVRDVATSDRDRVIVAHMVELAAALGHTVVAEGVEHQGQVETLHSLGCRLLQGFLFSEAVPLSELVELVERQMPEPVRMRDVAMPDPSPLSP